LEIGGALNSPTDPSGTSGYDQGWQKPRFSKIEIWVFGGFLGFLMGFWGFLVGFWQFEMRHDF